MEYNDAEAHEQARAMGIAQALGDVESASTGEHGAKSGRETAKVLGARPRTP